MHVFHVVFIFTLIYHTASAYSFPANVPFLYLLKTSGFLTFSECIEIRHWREMVEIGIPEIAIEGIEIKHWCEIAIPKM